MYFAGLAMNGVRCSVNAVRRSAFCSEILGVLFGDRFVRHGVFVRRWMFCSAFCSATVRGSRFARHVVQNWCFVRARCFVRRFVR